MTPAAQIRLAHADDAAALARFAAQVFTDTYRDLDDAKDIADYCAEHFQPAVLAEVITDPACTTFLAHVGEQLAGYAIVRDKAPPPFVPGPAAQLWRLYLDQRFIGQQLGARLMQQAQAEARRRGAATMWLGVYDRNVRAVEFYRRFGFAQVGVSEFLFGGVLYADPIYAVTLAPADGA
jgi:ribosomal protein S18 acetylase RimI-like enzyme